MRALWIRNLYLWDRVTVNRYILICVSTSGRIYKCSQDSEVLSFLIHSLTGGCAFGSDQISVTKKDSPSLQLFCRASKPNLIHHNLHSSGIAWHSYPRVMLTAMLEIFVGLVCAPAS